MSKITAKKKQRVLLELMRGAPAREVARRHGIGYVTANGLVPLAVKIRLLKKKK